MSTSIFAIDLSDTQLSWAYAQGSSRAVKLRQTHSQSFSSREEMATYIEHELVPKVKARDQVVVLLKGMPLFFRQLDFPFSAPRKIEAALPLEMDGKIPASMEGMELTWGKTEVGIGGMSRVPALALSQDALNEKRAFLEGLKLPISRFEPAPFAFVTTVAQQHTSCFLVHADDSCTSICLIDQGRAISYRLLGPADHLSQKDLAAAIARAVAILKREANCARLHAVLLGPRAEPTLQQTLERLNLRTRMLTLNNGNTPVPPNEQAAACVAMSSALESPRQRLHYQGTAAKKAQNTGRGLAGPRATLVMAVTALCLLVGGAAWSYQVKAQRQDQLQQQLETLFRATFSEGGRIQDVPRQMRQKLTELKQRGQRLQPNIPAPLAFLAEVSQTLPQGATVKLDTYGYDETEARLEGQCPDFDTLDSIKNLLEGLQGVESAQIADAKRQTDGSGVRFRMRLRFVPGDK